MLSQSDLDAIRSRAEATEGPWEPLGDYVSINTESYRMMIDCGGENAIATFIAHARTDVPALLDMVEELEGGDILNRKAIARKDARIAELERLLTKERSHKLGTPPPSYEKDAP